MIKAYEFKDHEEWKPVVGYEQKYEVSNTGKVRSLNYHRERASKELKQYIDRYGYLKVVLYDGGNPNYYTVHRLVATAFIPNPHGKKCVDHIDCDTTNNMVNNLRWVTNTENLQHSHNKKRQRINAVSIIAVSPNGEKFKFWSEKETARETGIGQWSVSRALITGKKYKGWEFKKYVQESN